MPMAVRTYPIFMRMMSLLSAGSAAAAAPPAAPLAAPAAPPVQRPPTAQIPAGVQALVDLGFPQAQVWL